MTVKASTEAIYLRWSPRKKQVILLTEDQKEHHLTLEDALDLFYGILKTIPNVQVKAQLRREGF